MLKYNVDHLQHSKIKNNISVQYLLWIHIFTQFRNTYDDYHDLFLLR